MRIITLTTDFGLSDWFVGTMKGVMLRINPRAQIVDITHAIPPGDIRSGAFALKQAYAYFPSGTVHVAVVDPGVGSGRTAVVVRTARHLFVGPDNGVLSYALAGERIRSMRRLSDPEFFLPDRSRTFDGRDVFAPVAAHLSRGTSASVFGPPVDCLKWLRWPEPERFGNRLRGEVLWVDRFGNAITNLAGARIRSGVLSVRFGRFRLDALSAFYAAVPLGEPVAVISSNGLLEIAVHGGSAAKKYGLRRGSKVSVTLASGAG